MKTSIASLPGPGRSGLLAALLLALAASCGGGDKVAVGGAPDGAPVLDGATSDALGPEGEWLAPDGRCVTSEERFFARQSWCRPTLAETIAATCAPATGESRSRFAQPMDCPAGQVGIRFGDDFGGFTCDYEEATGRFVGGTFFVDTRAYCERSSFSVYTERPFQPCSCCPARTPAACPTPDAGS